MSQHMMQFGNQQGGYPQSGNYAGYSPPGGGPPPPGQNSPNYPQQRSYPAGPPPSNAMQKNFSPPASVPPAGFMVPGGHGLPPGAGVPPSVGLPPGPGMPPVSGLPPVSGVPPGSGMPLSAGISNKPSNFQTLMQPQGSNPMNGPPMTQQNPSHSSDSSVHPPTSQQHQPSPNLGPGNEMKSVTSVSQSMGPRMSGPLNTPGSQGMLNNGPHGLSNLGSQSQVFSGPPGPLPSNLPPRVGGPPFEPSFTNGSPLMTSQPHMLQSPGQAGPTDSNRQQFINGTPQLPQPGPPSSHPRPPMNFGPPSQMQPSSGGPVRPMYPPTSNINSQSPNMQSQQLSSPYPASQQIRSPYPQTPQPANFNKGNYPSGPSAQPSEMRPGYPPINQGPYQHMNQQYSGINQNYPSMTNYPQSQVQQKTQRKLDPDMLPNPIQVMQDDEKNRSGIFRTDQKGLMPPLVTTKFITQDLGNCSPRFLRATTYNVPVTADLLKQTSVPFALLISPLARLADGEQPLPIVNMGELGPVRCVRCKAYMSPFMQFIDGGRRFHCVFCKATSEVPAEYFQHLDHTGQRVDRYERPELLLGAYEYVATKDYCRNNQPTEPPAIIFVIDVSYNNVKSGLVHLLCSRMKEIIRNLPRDEGLEVSNMKVGFITYSSSVHFYNINSCLAAPQMLLVGDVNEMFMPLLDGFLCDPIESEVVIDLLMQEIPRQFAETRETETILYPAIQAGLEALKASNCAGKLLVFHSSLPIAEAPGKLKNRDDRKVLNTDKEKSVLAPQNNSYNNLGQECVKVGCSVDLFIFNNSYTDLATIGEVSRITGGEIFKYTYFQADIDGERFIADLKRDVSRQTAFDAIMRVRTSTGVRPTDFYGHFFMSNTKDMELASIDSDKAVAVEIKHDDKLTEEDGVYIQVALLYTSCGGQRRLRILNLSLKTCSQMADLYRTCDLDTLVNYISKQGIFKLLEHSPKQVKNDIMNRCANILACYRKNCANPSSTGQLILPECMKLLPLYVNTLLKSDAFSGGSDMTCDDRSFAIHTVMIMDLTVSVVYFYPRLVAVHNIDPDCYDSPVPIRCTYEKLQDDGVYLLDNGIHMFMWLGLNAPTSFISNVFGVPTAPQVDTDKTALPALDNPLSLKIRNLIDEIREKRHRSMRLTVLKERDKMEMVFKQYLMEDHGSDGSPSYGDFLCHMHSQIRTILS